MKKTSMKKATKVNLQESILDALKEAVEICFERTGVSIRKSPEYFLNIYIVKEICDNFPRVGFRLEMKFSELFKKLGVNPIIPKHIKKGAKFDIVLTSRNRNTPRHVIEVKRSILKRHIVKEARRILFVAEADHGNKRLKIGFIACVTRIKKKGTPAEVVIATRVKDIESTVGNGFKVSEIKKEYNCGEYRFPRNEKLLLVVFKIEKI